MPKMNGFELYQQLKKKDSYVTVCFLTAVSEFRDYEQYKSDVSPKPNERYFVAKPVSEDDLVRRVNDMISNNNNHSLKNSYSNALC
jgi:response regulator RpfG family c-di-GMP phosphodiesterase